MATRDPRGGRTRRSAAAVAACVTLLALLAAGCGTSKSGREEQRAAPAERAPVVSGLAAYVAESEGRTVVVTGALDDSSWRVHRVPGDPAPRSVGLSPSADGRVVAISAWRGEPPTMISLHVLDVRSGSMRRLPLPKGAYRGLAVSPDGATIALAEHLHLSVVPTAGGVSMRLPAAVPTPAPEGVWVSNVRWSPAGRSLLYELWHQDPNDPRMDTTYVELFVLPTARPRPKLLAPMPWPYPGPAGWSPDSQRVAMSGSDPGTLALVRLRAGAKAVVRVDSTYPFPPNELVWTRRGIYTSFNDLVLVDPATHGAHTVALRKNLLPSDNKGTDDFTGAAIVAPPSGDVVALLARRRLRVFSPTGETVLDRTLRGAPDAPATGGFAVVLVDP